MSTKIIKNGLVWSGLHQCSKSIYIGINAHVTDVTTDDGRTDGNVKIELESVGFAISTFSEFPILILMLIEFSGLHLAAMFWHHFLLLASYQLLPSAQKIYPFTKPRSIAPSLHNEIYIFAPHQVPYLKTRRLTRADADNN